MDVTVSVMSPNQRLAVQRVSYVLFRLAPYRDEVWDRKHLTVSKKTIIFQLTYGIAV